MVGAVACNNVALLKMQPLEALKTKDGFGRTAAMLAALFNSWDVLQHLLRVSGGINWSESQSAQASSADPHPSCTPAFSAIGSNMLCAHLFAGWPRWQDSHALLV